MTLDNSNDQAVVEPNLGPKGNYDELIKELEYIAKRVGGDFSLKFQIGPPGSTTFFAPQLNLINIDGGDISEFGEGSAKFLAAHEGAHCRITKSDADFFGKTEEELLRLRQEPGFHFGHNGVEDCAVNDWATQCFPNLKKREYELYSKSFTKTIEEKKIQSGYMPKVNQYVASLINEWFAGNYLPQIAIDVIATLRRTEKSRKDYIAQIPPDMATFKEINDAARSRNSIYLRKIYPEIKKLAEDDIKTEAQRQAMQGMLQQHGQQSKGSQGQQSQQKGESSQEQSQQSCSPCQSGQQQSQGSQGQQSQQQGSSSEQKSQGQQGNPSEQSKQQEKNDSGQSQGDPFEKMDEQSKKEVQEKSQQAKDKLEDHLQKKLEEAKKDLEQSQSQQKSQGLEKQVQDLEKKMADLKQNKNLPVPFDDFSPKTRADIRRAYDQLPQETKDALEKSAKKQLAKEMDESSKSLQGKAANKQQTMTQEQIEKALEKLQSGKGDGSKEGSDDQPGQSSESQAQSQQIAVEVSASIRGSKNKAAQEMESDRNAYEKVRATNDAMICKITEELKRILIERKGMKYKNGFDSGIRLDIGMAMQAKADKRLINKIWQQKTLPHKYSYRFHILIDASGSMSGQSAYASFEGMVIISAVLARLKIISSISAFQGDGSDGGVLLKSPSEAVSESDKQNISRYTGIVGGGTPLAEAMISSYNLMKKDLGTANFLIVITDGAPNDASACMAAIEMMKKERMVKLFGIGLGSGTQQVVSLFPRSFYVNNIRSSRDGKTFAQLLIETIKTMVINPDEF